MSQFWPNCDGRDFGLILGSWPNCCEFWKLERGSRIGPQVVKPRSGRKFNRTGKVPRPRCPVPFRRRSTARWLRGTRWELPRPPRRLGSSRECSSDAPRFGFTRFFSPPFASCGIAAGTPPPTPPTRRSRRSDSADASIHAQTSKASIDPTRHPS